MIITRLRGGLGNQMFQYAVARAVAYRVDMPLKMDIRSFKKDSLRRYSLGYFNIKEEFATEEEIESLNPDRRNIRNVVEKIKERTKPWYERKLIKETSFSYNPDILKIKKSAYIKGYWQSEKYFKDISEVIREDFTFKKEPDKIYPGLIERINDVNSVSLHIRRGDYGTNKKFYLLSLDYYCKGIDLITSRVKKPEFFVFSDDIRWAKENLKLSVPCTFVEQNSKDRDCEELRLMTGCKHHIIANSSFSWWGAWLCNYSEKIVVAPGRWFATPVKDTKDLLPEGWLKI